MAFLYKIARRNHIIPDPRYIKDPFWSKIVEGADYVNELVQPVRSFAQNTYFGTDLPTTLEEVPHALVKAGLSHVTGGIPAVEDAKNIIDTVRTYGQKRKMKPREIGPNGPMDGPVKRIRGSPDDSPPDSSAGLQGPLKKPGPYYENLRDTIKPVTDKTFQPGPRESNFQKVTPDNYIANNAGVSPLGQQWQGAQNNRIPTMPEPANSVVGL